MADLRPLGFHWLGWWARPYEPGGETSGSGRWFGVACPHCTNLDTLSRHCANGRCDWAHCACGALVYSKRGHRHPRHGSDQDTCHSPHAAV